MKNITLSLGALVAISSLGFAGGDIAPIEEGVMSPVVIQSNDSGVYIGLGMSAFDLDFTNSEVGEDKFGNATFILGYNFNQYMAVEGRYTSSFTKEDLAEVDGWSLFVKPQYILSEDFSVYALLGYGGVNMDGVNNTRIDVSENGFQWGLGASYAIGDNYTIFLDYTSLASEMDGVYYNGGLQVDADVLTIGATYKF